MKRQLIFTITICLFMNAVTLMALDLPIGTSTSELGLKTLADVGEFYGKGLPLGPAAFRFAGDTLWVSDSLNKRFVAFDQAGKLVKSVAIASESHIYPEDFVILPDGSFWACDVDNAALIKLDAEGKIVSQVTTVADKKLAWPFRIELLPSGNLLLLDLTLGELIEFSEDGALLWTAKAYGRSFLVTSDSIVYIVEKDQQMFLTCKKHADGKISSSLIPVSDVLDLELLAKTSQDEYAVGFKSVRADKDQMPYFLMRFSARGDKPFSTMQIGFPEPFLTRPLITQTPGKDFLIRLIQQDKARFLRLSPIALDFSLENSGG